MYYSPSSKFLTYIIVFIILVSPLLLFIKETGLLTNLTNSILPASAVMSSTCNKEIDVVVDGPQRFTDRGKVVFKDADEKFLKGSTISYIVNDSFDGIVVENYKCVALNDSGKSVEFRKLDSNV